MSTCAESARSEPLAGTAPFTAAWVVIEQHGAYPRKALTALPPGLVDWAEATHAAGAKVILARPTGRHATTDQPAERRVWVAHAESGRMVSTCIHSDADLTGIDPKALMAGDLPNWPAADEPHLFVCTNGRRDACCAARGGAAVRGNSDTDVWESSHLGGHRFAATGVLLPWGFVLGRLDADAVRTVMSAARRGRVVPETLRGRSCLSPAAQAAEVALRREADVVDATALTVLAEPGARLITIGHRDGRRWQVTVAQRRLPERPESCGAEAVEAAAWDVTSIRRLLNNLPDLLC